MDQLEPTSFRMSHWSHQSFIVYSHRRYALHSQRQRYKDNLTQNRNRYRKTDKNDFSMHFANLKPKSVREAENARPGKYVSELAGNTDGGPRSHWWLIKVRIPVWSASPRIRAYTTEQPTAFSHDWCKAVCNPLSVRPRTSTQRERLKENSFSICSSSAELMKTRLGIQPTRQKISQFWNLLQHYKVTWFAPSFYQITSARDRKLGEWWI